MMATKETGPLGRGSAVAAWDELVQALRALRDARTQGRRAAARRKMERAWEAVLGAAPRLGRRVGTMVGRRTGYWDRT